MEKPKLFDYCVFFAVFLIAGYALAVGVLG